MTEAEFLRVQKFVREKTGVDLSQKRALIEGRLERHLVQNGFHSYTEYMQKVENDLSGKEVEQMVTMLTTHHTYFLREPVHFDLFKEEVLPYLRKKEATSRDLRIWSAAASTGEEPYTIAMIIKDFFGLDHSGWDTKILATDVSTHVLEFAGRGKYTKEQIDVLPPTWKKRYFHLLQEGKYEAKPELKQEIIFRQFNLMHPLPFKKKFHVIFLRNVMIYFEEETKRDLVQRLYDFLEPGGYLFIGTTEAIDRNAFGFEYVMPSVYRKPEKEVAEWQK